MSTIRNALLTAISAAALVVLFPQAATGQSTRRIVVTPYAGVFVPSTQPSNIRTDAGTSLNSAPAARVVSLNASYWFNDRTGMEFGAAAMSDTVSRRPVRLNAGLRLRDGRLPR